MHATLHKFSRNGLIKTLKSDRLEKAGRIYAVVK